MKKQINLFLDFEFTSLGPDAQPISLGIISDCDMSIYCEFSDFDLNRCDDWVKENVVAKLKWWNNKDVARFKYDSTLRLGIDGEHFGSFKGIKHNLKHWLEQFKDYHIQFVCDRGTFDFCHLLQLIGEWEEKEDTQNDCPSCGYMGQQYKTKPCIHHAYKSGLPKLPPNISPVPQDLNDLIAIKKGISVKEAFELNREELILELKPFFLDEIMGYSAKLNTISPKHNALWDAKVIKAIYESLK